MGYNSNFMKHILLAFLLLPFSSAICAEDVSKQLENHFDIYLIKPERRSPMDRIVVRNDVATIFYWESAAKRKPDEVICDAYEYLLLGRTTYGKGAQEAFEENANLKKIELALYDYEFSTQKGEHRAEILPTQRMFEYLKISVVRESLMRKSLNRKGIRKMIDDRQCAEIGKNYIDSVSIKDDYFTGKK